MPIYKITIQALKLLCIDNGITIKSKMTKKDLVDAVLNSSNQHAIDLFNKVKFETTTVTTTKKANSDTNVVKRCKSITTNSKKVSVVKKKSLEQMVLKLQEGTDYEKKTLEAKSYLGKFFTLDKFVINSKGCAIGTVDNGKLDNDDACALLEIGIPVDVDSMALKITLENVCEECAGILKNCIKCGKNEFELDFDNDDDADNFHDDEDDDDVDDE